MNKDKTMPILTTANYAKANQARLALNQMILEKGKNITEAEKAKGLEAITDALEGLNEEVKNTEYSTLLAAENPVLTAIKMGKFNLYKIRYVSETDDDPGEYLFAPHEYMISLKELSDAAKTNIFHNGQWFYWAEAFNHAIYEMRAEKLGIPVEKRSKRLKKWKISALAKEFEIGDITTKSGATKTLQRIFDGVLYEETADSKGKKVNAYKIDGRDTTALLDNYSKWGKTLGTTVFPSDDTFTNTMLMHVFNRVVTDGVYNGDQS